MPTHTPSPNELLASLRAQIDHARRSLPAQWRTTLATVPKPNDAPGWTAYLLAFNGLAHNATEDADDTLLGTAATHPWPSLTDPAYLAERAIAEAWLGATEEDAKHYAMAASAAFQLLQSDARLDDPEHFASLLADAILEHDRLRLDDASPLDLPLDEVIALIEPRLAARLDLASAFDPLDHLEAKAQLAGLRHLARRRVEEAAVAVEPSERQASVQSIATWLQHRGANLASPQRRFRWYGELKAELRAQSPELDVETLALAAQGASESRGVAITFDEGLRTLVLEHTDDALIVTWTDLEGSTTLDLTGANVTRSSQHQTTATVPWTLLATSTWRIVGVGATPPASTTTPPTHPDVRAPSPTYAATGGFHPWGPGAAPDWQARAALVRRDAGGSTQRGLVSLRSYYEATWDAEASELSFRVYGNEPAVQVTVRDDQTHDPLPPLQPEPTTDGAIHRFVLPHQHPVRFTLTDGTEQGPRIELWPDDDAVLAFLRPLMDEEMTSPDAHALLWRDLQRAYALVDDDDWTWLQVCDHVAEQLMPLCTRPDARVQIKALIGVGLVATALEAALPPTLAVADVPWLRPRLASMPPELQGEIVHWLAGSVLSPAHLKEARDDTDAR